MHRILSAALLTGLCVASPASAVSLSFVGNFSIVDDAPDGFSEHLTFDNPIGPNEGAVSVFDPAGDGLFADAGIETVGIAPLFLDPGNPFDFSPTVYTDGFRLYDDDGSLLLEADLTVTTLDITGSTAGINPTFAVNLGNLSAGGGYLSGSSVLIDGFLAAGAGSLSITLQVPVADLASAILAGATVSSSSSGSAAAPEPAVMLLLGTGLLGLAVQGRKRGARAV